MEKRKLAEILYDMAMDMDWMDYEDTKESVIDKLESELEEAGETLIWALEKIAMPYT